MDTQEAKNELWELLDLVDGGGARPYLLQAMDNFLRLLDAADCSSCGGNTADNPLSQAVYRDWNYDLHQAVCFHCAAASLEFQSQQPGEFPGADSRYWWQGNAPDAILGRYHSANFWLKAATQRAEQNTQPANGPNEAETRRRPDAAAHFLAIGDYPTARLIIEPIGKPGYYDYGIATRPWAFDALNVRRLRNAWEAVADAAAAQLAALLEAHPNPTTQQM